MSPDEQNAAIAEALGAEWHEVPPREGYSYRPLRLLSFHKWDFGHPRCAPLPLPNPQGDATDIPKYAEDLNACHEMEKVLTEEQQNIYQCILSNLTAGQRFDTYCHWSEVGSGFVVHATAPQRCEAFLRTLNLWTP